MGYGGVGEGDGDDGGAAGDRPIRGDVEPLPPNHDSAHLAAVKMRHGVDVARIVNAALERDSRLLIGDRCAVFGCHGRSINWMTAAESNNSCFICPLP